MPRSAQQEPSKRKRTFGYFEAGRSSSVGKTNGMTSSDLPAGRLGAWRARGRNVNIGRGETRIDTDAQIETHPIELAWRTMAGSGLLHEEHRDEGPR